MNANNLEDFLNQVKEFENGHQLDLSSSEDLSIGLMNLISMEEHLFFTAEKTGNENYLEVMSQVRQIRKAMQKELVKDTDGEVWCICKHALAASMRLLETGNKIYVKDPERSYQFFHQAYELYNLFWLLNLKLVKPSDQAQTKTETDSSKATELEQKTAEFTTENIEPTNPEDPPTEPSPTAQPTSDSPQVCKWKNFSKALSENLDCCHE